MLALAEFNVNPYDLVNDTMTFSDAWDAWSPKHFEKYPASEGGLKSAYKKCKPLYKLKMSDIKTAHLQAVMDELSGMSVESQTKVKTIFKNCFKYAIQNDIIKKDYSEFVTLAPTKGKTKKENYFTASEIDLIFKNRNYKCEFPTGKKSYCTLELVDSIIVLLYSGMRIGELLALKCEDVNLLNRIMHVRGTKTKDADRLVPIHKKLIPILKSRLAGEFVFENGNGEPIRYDSYKKNFFDPFMKSLGLSQTPHACRHTFISMMDSAGVSASSVVLKRIVGHANASTTEHYTHKETSELVNVIDKI